MFYFYIFLTESFSGDFSAYPGNPKPPKSPKNRIIRSFGYTLDGHVNSRNETMVVGQVLGGWL